MDLETARQKWDEARLKMEKAQLAYLAATKGTDERAALYAGYKAAQLASDAACATYHELLKAAGLKPDCYDSEYSKRAAAGEPLTDREAATRPEITAPAAEGIPGVTVPCPKCGTYCHGDCETN